MFANTMDKAKNVGKKAVDTPGKAAAAALPLGILLGVAGTVGVGFIKKCRSRRDERVEQNS